ncbi:DUF503 domain-containing protein [Kroppenstedtia pulmonis]|uniref:DUF503 domain-containing protein n=1 Tax=Kroppenstedtia pulmonis TaxID=1380685 RepID=A0A7D3Y0L2_9BACL|nr:DUF503 domain-containing protein [Kroppenstedtia pulmonis]QKG84560.1 DUF503 domain-containing protein [Kroppenstedtia pulmonis]
MVVAVLECRCRVLGSTSLKDKRRAVKSGLSRIRSRFNLSVAEVGAQDHRQWAELAVAGVGSNRRLLEQELTQARKLLEQIDDLEIMDADIIFL